MKHKTKKRTKLNEPKRIIVVVAAFAAVGIALLARSLASNASASLEPELGQTSGVDSLSSGQVSAGGYIRFKSAGLAPLKASGNTDTLPNNLVFSDEFSGTTLNSNNWKTGWFENSSGISNPVQSRELQCYDRNMVSVTGGNLSLRSTASDVLCPDGVTRHIRSGAVTSRDKVIFDYGYFEARIRNSFDSAAGQPGYLYNWPAFWTVTNNEDAWPEQGELDILEGSGGTADANWHGPVSTDSGHKIAEKTMTNNWHVYAANWQSGTVTAYFDGVRVGSYSSTSDVVNFQHCLNLMLQYNPNYASKNQVPDEMLVDYVRVWQ